MLSCDKLDCKHFSKWSKGSLGVIVKNVSKRKEECRDHVVESLESLDICPKCKHFSCSLDMYTKEE